MTAEELMDALSQVTGNQEEFPGMPVGMRAIQLPDTKVKSDFMDVLGRPPRVITCECERSQEPNMAQALLFINGELINRKVSATGGLVDKLIGSGKQDGEILDELYWAALGRDPRASERTASLAAIRKATLESVKPTPVNSPLKTAAATAKLSSGTNIAAAGTNTDSMTSPTAAAPAAQMVAARRHVFEDMFWVLLNSKEFLFNH
jgi:hypothetical protein